MIKNNHLRVVKNAISLAVVRGGDILAQLITMPFIISTVGIDRFGSISFYFAIIQYLNMFCDFGFNFTATRDISINREDKNAINRIFSIVMAIKVGIALLCIFVLVILGFICLERNVCFFLILAVIGFVLFPTWIFQGFEKMKYIAFVKFFSRIIYVILICLFVKEADDYQNVILIESVSIFFMGLFGYILSFCVFKIKFISFNLSELFFCLKDSSYMFFSSLFIALYRNSNIFILGVFTSNIYVGFYAAAEKVVRAIQALIEPLISALYPFVSKRFLCYSLQDNVKFIFKISLICLIVIIPLVIVVIWFANNILLLLSIDNNAAIRDLRVMIFAVLFGTLNYVMGIVGLTNLGFNKLFLFCVSLSGLISVLFTLLLVPFYKDLASATSLVIGESVLFLMLTVILFRKFHQETRISR